MGLLLEITCNAVRTSVDLYPKFVTPWFAGFISIEVTSLSIVGGLYGKCKKKRCKMTLNCRNAELLHVFAYMYMYVLIETAIFRHIVSYEDRIYLFTVTVTFPTIQ